MKPTLSFVAPIRVVGYQRAHAIGNRRIKPKATRDCMARIKLFAQASKGAPVPAGHAVNVHIGLCYSNHTRPDIDNAVKTVLDALKGVAWVDDRQVTELTSVIIVGQSDSVSVSVYDLGEAYTPKKRKPATARGGE